MNNLTIENDFLKIDLISNGAELKSIYNKKNNTEYLWQADPAFWGKSSPILFPIVGGLKNDSYIYENKEYSLPRHGFARDLDFSVISNDKSRAVLELQWNEDTYKVYPFKFKLQIEYKLTNNSLEVFYNVKNSDNKDLMFSIGGHPAFNCPIDKNLNFEDYSLEFNCKENNKLLFIEDDLVTKEHELELKNDTTINLKHSLFDNDALVFQNLKSNSVTLSSNKDAKSVKFYYPNFDYVAFWTKDKPLSPFLCIEPWFGIDDYADSSSIFEQKKGIKSIEPNTSFNTQYIIEIN